MKSAQKMKLEKTKKTMEPMKLKKGPKEKDLKTSKTMMKEQEGNGKMVKSKMKINH